MCKLGAAAAKCAVCCLWKRPSASLPPSHTHTHMHVHTHKKCCAVTAVSWAKEMLGNVRQACCVGGTMDLVVKEEDLLEVRLSLDV
jgi:hypothetical protein